MPDESRRASATTTCLRPAGVASSRRRTRSGSCQVGLGTRACVDIGGGVVTVAAFHEDSGYGWSVTLSAPADLVRVVVTTALTAAWRFGHNHDDAAELFFQR